MLRLGITLYLQGLRVLMPESWIDDSVTNAFMIVLDHVHQGGPLLFDVYFVEALMKRKEGDFGYYVRSKSEQAWTRDCWLILINND